MMILITGGSSSGKSALAERLAVDMAAGQFCGTSRGLIYLATMDPGEDPENQVRIAKHQEQRRGLGFVTVECPVHLSGLAESSDRIRMQGRVVLLECLSNLLANEMFADWLAADARENASSDAFTRTLQATPAVNTIPARIAVERIEQGLLWLEQQVSHLIVVSNDIFSDAIIYDDRTREYIEALGRLNRFLAGRADAAIEAYYGLYQLRHDASGKAGDWLCSNGLTAC